MANINTLLGSNVTSATTTALQENYRHILDTLAEKELYSKGSSVVVPNKKQHFSGFFKKFFHAKDTYITSVMYYDPATIVFWNDGTKTVCKCKEGDEYCPEAGLAMCILKKLIGASNLKDIFNDWILYGNGEVTVKDVRKKHRDDK